MTQIAPINSNQIQKNLKQISFNQNIVVDFNSNAITSHKIYYPTFPEQRFVEILEASSFLFSDGFLRNVVEPLKKTTFQIDFFEKMLFKLNQDNYDFARKLQWVLSKLYLKKSYESQSLKRIDDALHFHRTAQTYFAKYCSFTEKIKFNPILSTEKYLQKSNFLNKKSFEMHGIKLRNQGNVLRFHRGHLSAGMNSVQIPLNALDDKTGVQSQRVTIGTNPSNISSVAK